MADDDILTLHRQLSVLPTFIHPVSKNVSVSKSVRYNALFEVPTPGAANAVSPILESVHAI